MKLKKILYYLAVGSLTCGASLILGLLSFSGMYALMPFLGLAVAAFGLSVAYEGEIYLQNIKGAFTKIFKTNYLERHLAKDYLLTMFPEKPVNGEDVRPQFFKDYEAQLKALSKFGHKTLNAESKKRKKGIEKTLSDLEKSFALKLFSESGDEKTHYAQELGDWLTENKQDEWKETLKTRRFWFYGIGAFSVLAGAFAGLGTTYLLVGAFSAIPFLAGLSVGFWPVLILPMAFIAGTAYGMLVYNSVTDFINNDTLKKEFNKFCKNWTDWWQKTSDDFKQWHEGLDLDKTDFISASLSLLACAGRSAFGLIRNALWGIFTAGLVGLAVALTIFTAGTWWTVVANTKPLFEWMARIPFFITSIIYPTVTGVGSLFFIVNNTLTTLDQVDSGLASIEKWIGTAYDQGFINTLLGSVKKWLEGLKKNENLGQIFNPFRILTKLIVIPARIVLFIGHLLSIALTADRMPGMPYIISFLVAIISEGFEDAHYFIGHSHDHGHSTPTLLKARLDISHSHNHDLDIPTWIVKILASPLYFLAALWDFGFSQLSETPTLSLTSAWNKQWGNKEEKDVVLKEGVQSFSVEGKKDQIISVIRKEKSRLHNVWVDKDVADDKVLGFNSLVDALSSNNADVPKLLKTAANNPVFNRHRFSFFAVENDETHSQTCINGLVERANLN